MSWNFYGFRPYVPVAERQRRAQKELAKLAKKGLTAQPVRIEGRTIARSFWGVAWCDNLESYMDYANRLPRGRTYVRNGSVVHLDVKPGKIEAMVSGTELYRVNVTIAPVAERQWKCLCRECSGGIGSLVELLQGRLSDRVMGIITRKETGLFPSPREIKMSCSCPDSAGLCKHLAAVLYGVGARLDTAPELLFVLRSVDHQELITEAADVSQLTTKGAGAVAELSESEAAGVFGIEIDSAAPAIPAPAEPASAPAPRRRMRTKSAAKAPAKPKRAAARKQRLR